MGLLRTAALRRVTFDKVTHASVCHRQAPGTHSPCQSPLLTRAASPVDLPVPPRQQTGKPTAVTIGCEEIGWTYSAARGGAVAPVRSMVHAMETPHIVTIAFDHPALSGHVPQHQLVHLL